VGRGQKKAEEGRQKPVSEREPEMIAVEHS
jgi:hypothetical protein